MMKNKIKVKPIIFIIISILLIGLGTTLALYQNKYSFKDDFNSAALNVVIEDEFTSTPWCDIPTAKKVSIVNHEESDVVIRVSYDEVWSKTLSDETVQISNLVNGENVVIKNWTQAFLDDFTLKEDGWYYYNKVLKGNGSITILESIQLNNDLVSQSGDDYSSYDYELDFDFEALQNSEEAIKSVWGLTATIQNDIVTW